MPEHLPYNLDSEKAVLSAMFNDGDAAIKATELLAAEDFYSNAHRTLYEAMGELRAASKGIDFVTLTDALEASGRLEAAGGYEYIGELATFAPSIERVAEYAGIVLRTSTQRNLYRLGLKIEADGKNAESDPEETIGYALAVIEKLTGRATSRKREIWVADLVSEVIDRLDRATSDPEAFGSDIVLTGWRETDHYCPLSRGNMVTIAGRTSMGKSALAESMSLSMTGMGHKGLYVSLEMSTAQMGDRIMSKLTGIPIHPIRINNITGRQFDQIWPSLENIRDRKLLILDAPGSTPSSIKMDCKRMKAKCGLDFVVIDHLGLVRPDKGRENRNRVQEISSMTAFFKEMAREIDIIVFLVCQLNREVEKRDDKRPILADLRESGSIEQDSDIVWMLYRDSYYAKDKMKDKILPTDKNAEMLVPKNRNGPTWEIRLLWDKDTASYRERVV
jgi:replicative DNA helicase